MTCSNCGKDFKFVGAKTRYSYGFVKGKPFCALVCDDCRKKMSDEEYNELERRLSEKIKWLQRQKNLIQIQKESLNR